MKFFETLLLALKNCGVTAAPSHPVSAEKLVRRPSQKLLPNETGVIIRIKHFAFVFVEDFSPDVTVKNLTDTRDTAVMSSVRNLN